MRDNIFRALAQFDPDYSRNIEDATVRVSWSEDSLLELVTERLRAVFSTTDTKPLRIWDRFAQNELKGRAGFRHVLRHTLYRPRDVLALLNKAWLTARGASRKHIVLGDLDSAAKSISNTRLDDLKKEYRRVLPGVDDFVSAFQHTEATCSYAAALARLKTASESFSLDAKQSIEILGGPSGAFLALYSIGFLGVRATGGEYEFSHDGANVGLRDLQLTNEIAVHPCYWQALDVQGDDLPVEVAVRLHDEYDARGNEDLVRDQRLKQLGKALAEFDQIKEGPVDAARFEGWVHRAILVLFSGVLIDPVVQPNKASAERRDIVATNAAVSGFWKRMLDSYKCKHVVFQVRNQTHLDEAEFNQAVAYGGERYGAASFIVHRGGAGRDEDERAQIKTRYFGKHHLIIVLPATLLLLCLKKQRSERRSDYTDNALIKLLDTYEKQYVGLGDATRQRKRRRQRRGRASDLPPAPSHI